MADGDLLGGGAPGAPAPGGKPKMNPRQKRLMIAAGVGLALALVFLLQRRGAPAETAAADTPAETTGLSAVPASPGVGSTFADNGEAAGALSSSITSSLAEVAAGNADLAQAFDDLSQNIARPTSPAITLNVAPGPLGKVGSPRQTHAVATKKATSKLTKARASLAKDRAGLARARAAYKKHPTKKNKAAIGAWKKKIAPDKKTIRKYK